jgi:GTP cyclohydrolase I
MVKTSDKIKARIEKSGDRYYANSNISKFIKAGELDKLEKEITEAFRGVLDSLIIDQTNDPNSEGTAHRLAKMYLHETMRGRYYPDPKVTSFPNDEEHRTHPYDQLLVVRAEIKSMCSHHHQPVTGTAYIGIIPGDKVLGLSKYVRIAQHHARRGTLQEELCEDIAAAVEELTQARGVGVYIEAEHGCCTNRGINAKSSLTQTTVLKGCMKDDQTCKAEFIDNIKLQHMCCGR